MSSEESLEDRQNNEVAVIKSIFGENVHDLRDQDPFPLRRPPDLQIRVFPPYSVNNEAHVSVTLVIRCDENYPISVPSIKLTDPRGISDNLLKEFSLELEKTATKLKGQECMFPLIDMVQHFLHANNTPAAKSFYEQMLLNRQTEAKKIADEERKTREQAERQKELEYMNIEKQVEERKTYLQAQEKVAPHVHFKEDLEIFDSGVRTTDQSENKENSNKILEFNQRSRSKSIDKLTSKSLLAGTKELVRIDLKGGRTKQCMLVKSFPQSPRGCFVHYISDMDNRNNLMVLNEWILRWSLTKKKVSAQLSEQLGEEAQKYLRQLDSIDAEFQSLLRLRNPGLVGYVGWTYGFKKDHVFIHVVKDFVHGTPLSSFLKQRFPMSMDQIKLCAKQVLTSLSYLHQNNVPHRHMCPSSVLLNDDGNFVLADHAIEKRVEELYQFSLGETTDIGGSSRSGKKTDILQLGNLLCALLQGAHLEKEILEVPPTVPMEIQDFLKKCMPALEKDRWSADQLLNHPFLKSRSGSINEPFVIPTAKEKGFYSELKTNAAADDDDTNFANQLAARSLSLPTESRLHREFEILEFCGRGGFGDVLKVRNVLDGRTYAIKRIPLSETRDKLNKRILREVQLLSRLNHENIVRYYNSWIETVTSPPSASNTTSEMATSTPSKAKKFPEGFVNSLGLDDDIEKNAPPVADGSVDWSSEDGTAANATGESSSELSAMEEGGFFGHSYPHKVKMSSESGSVEFEHDGSQESEDDSNSKAALAEKEDQPEIVTTTTANLTTSSKSPVPHVVLFIQMEFCEKSTLRNIIDDGLYKDQERVWRLLREILEGIGHIHQQGVIHRDLKPANIFIDSQDHVRLGDFGLATHTLLSRSTFADNSSDMNELSELADETSTRTGRVGTALYVAPELCDNATKISYTQKVDMYSLGVCFFEMCYKPLPTGMERIKILTAIRKSSPQFPEDFDPVTMQRQMTLLNWLLKHDPKQRPNAVELLQSDLLPPPKIEDAEMNEIIRHTVQNPQSKAYKLLISSLFSQRIDAVTDLTYDSDVQRTLTSTRAVLAFEEIRDRISRVLHLHGAVYFDTPLLMPKPQSNVATSSFVNLMDSSGAIVTVAHDLRIPFARYVARNNVTNMKRFCLGRVYRNLRINYAHPRELYECAFDIISSSPNSQMADAECLMVVAEIIKEFPELSGANFRVRLNHIGFVQAAFLDAGCPIEKLNDAVEWLIKIRLRLINKSHAKQRLAELFDIKEHAYAFLEKFIETETTMQNVAAMVKNITRRKNTAAGYIKKAVQETETFIGLCEKMGLTFPIDVCLGMIDKYMRSGLVFHVVQVMSSKGSSHSHSLEIFAAGGRYTNLFSRQSAVDVLICALGSSPMLKEQLTLLRDFRSHGIRADILTEISAIENVQIFCRDMGIHLIQLKDNICSIRLIDPDKEGRVMEKKMPVGEAVDFLAHRLGAAVRTEIAESQSRSAILTSQISDERCNTAVAQVRTAVRTHFCTSESCKLSARDKKRHSNHVLTVLEPIISTFSAQVSVEVFAMDLPGNVLKWLPVHMTFILGGRVEFSDWAQLCDKFPRHRKFFNSLQSELVEQSFDSRCRIIVFSFLDDTYRLIS